MFVPDCKYDDRKDNNHVGDDKQHPKGYVCRKHGYDVIFVTVIRLTKDNMLISEKTLDKDVIAHTSAYSHFILRLKVRCITHTDSTTASKNAMSMLF